MDVALRILMGLAVLGTATSSIYCGMVIVAAIRFGVRKRREDSAPADFLPPVSVLKPMHGTEPGMEKNLQSFFELDYPKFELVFCARRETDEGLKLARRVATRYPEVDAHFVTCGEPTQHFHNAKVFSLARLDEAAKYEHLVTSDADVRVAKDYLLRMVQYLERPDVGLASCLYIGTVEAEAGTGRLSSYVDAVGKSVEMSSGVLVADMLEGTKFALGPTMSLRKKSFREAGGFAELGHFYAEDYVLGNRLANKGIGVLMATHIIRLMVRDQPFWGSFLDQLRWMRSTRRSRPWGHLGTGLTFAIPFGLMGLLWGFGDRSPGCRTALAAGHGGKPVVAGRHNPVCAWRSGLAAKHVSLSASRFAGNRPLGRKLWRQPLPLSWRDLCPQRHGYGRSGEVAISPPGRRQSACSVIGQNCLAARCRNDVRCAERCKVVLAVGRLVGQQKHLRGARPESPQRSFIIEDSGGIGPEAAIPETIEVTVLRHGPGDPCRRSGSSRR